MYVKSAEKVAYYYEDLNQDYCFSFNVNTTFYAASTIKILIPIYLYKNKINLNQTIKIEKSDLRPGSGILKNCSVPKDYSLKELLRMTIKYSDLLHM